MTRPPQVAGRTSGRLPEGSPYSHGGMQVRRSRAENADRDADDWANTNPGLAAVRRRDAETLRAWSRAGFDPVRDC